MKRFFWASIFVISSILISCGTGTVLLNGLGFAENSILTDDGRLFVSSIGMIGGGAVYEIHNNNGSFSKTKIAGNCKGATGLAHHENYLFALCDNGSGIHLSRADLHSETPTLETILLLEDFVHPNGMGVSEHSTLFIADWPGQAADKTSGKIVMVSDADTDTPIADVLVGPDNGASCPNGIYYDSGRLFYTNHDYTNGSPIAQIKMLNLNDDVIDPITLHEEPGANAPSMPGAGTLAYFDDLTYGSFDGENGVFVADFNLGRIVFVSNNGEVIIQPKKTLASPTSVVQAKGNFAPEGTLIVTQGYPGELVSTVFE